jgi:hypothetical protein
MDPKEYLEQFHIIGQTDLNCDMISQMLYSAYLNKFRTTMTQQEYGLFKEYQERVFNLVENMRELETTDIELILDHIYQVNPYLADIVIMSWSLPRTDNYLSKQIYRNRYRENIKNFNHKLPIQHDVIKKFCIETLSKTGAVPVHCIDLLWFYMVNLSIDFSFYNFESGAYIGITIVDTDEISIGLNMEYMLDMGLGQVQVNTRGSFRNFLKRLLTDTELVKL